ncbi:hypothetical protein [Paraburkholderia sp. Cpub6]|uniref:hypothetical protein n=1 Tax=Paraburkholderia sp. Cpub6 TaxID=2723094 RepID=UPI00160A692A|nr:hypothetical protein [Paraburkholderia sp. Cpub6]MBB5463479.1 tripartite-type tricarboxylate transporter receptor subunit TctC [Paraburkholderia sp. Cpub6]
MRNLLVLLAAPVPALQAMAAAPYPAKPIRIIVPFPVGSGTDAAARLPDQSLPARKPQPVIVENRPAASGFMAAQAAAPAVKIAWSQPE